MDALYCSGPMWMAFSNSSGSGGHVASGWAGPRGRTH